MFAASRYWMDNTGQFPIVHIFGIASHEGQEDARAGFACDWGPGDRRNRSGTAMGEKTKLRAELTALKAVLEQAVETACSKLVISHRSKDLAKELEKWDRKGDNEEHTFHNRDLLGTIGQLRTSVQVLIKPGQSNEHIGFKNVMLLAKRIAGLHSSAVVPVTDEHWEHGTRMVDIAGFSARVEGVDKSGYSVFWGPDDDRNRTGEAFRQQNTYRAELTALRVALETAKSQGFDEIIVRSRGQLIQKLVNTRQQCGKVKNSDLLRPNINLLRHFSSVKHLLPPKKIFVPGLSEADRIAREVSGARRSRVSIYGLGNDNPDGIASFGIYWSPMSDKNESGWIPDAHGELCAEIAALERALQLNEPGTHLTVFSNSEKLAKFVNEWRNGWKENGWPTTRSGGTVRCMEMAKAVHEYIEKSVIKVIHTDAADVPRARQLAESVGHCHTVHTAGIFQEGNNETVGEYVVFWGPDDEKNEKGVLPGKQCPIRTKLYAMRRALEIALKNDIKKLILFTDYSSKLGEDRKLILEIKILGYKMEWLKYKKNSTTNASNLAVTGV